MKKRRRQKAEGKKQRELCLPTAFCLVPSAFSSFIPHPSSVSASITFAGLLTGQRTFQSAVIELAFPDGLTFPSSSR
jgi:hypothetical protein